MTVVGFPGGQGLEVTGGVSGGLLRSPGSERTLE